MGLEPKWPVLAIEVVEQRKCQAIGRPLEGGTVFKQVGARDDNEFGSNKPSGFKARGLSQPMPDCQIDRLSPPGGCPSPRQFQYRDNVARTSRVVAPAKSPRMTASYSSSHGSMT